MLPSGVGIVACETCDGCGVIADDVNKTPWSVIEEKEGTRALWVGLTSRYKKVPCPECSSGVELSDRTGRPKRRYRRRATVEEDL